MELGEVERRADVVRLEHGRRVVVAGPGAGKTRLLVDRMVFLLAAGVPPRALLTLVFNRRAAAELRQRLATALPDRGLVELRIATFHSFSLSLADRFWRRTSLAGRPALLPTVEQRAVVRMLLARSPDPDGWTVPEAVRRSASFGRDVADGLLRLQEQLVAAPAGGEATPLVRCLARYESVLAGRARLDHAGVLAVAAELADDEAVRAALGVEHLLVDEYQDVNPAQEALVERLARSAGSVVVVGDPEQAIYGFRGASTAALARATERLGATEVRLTTGFRCPQAVIDAAGALTTAPPLVGRTDAPGGVAAAAFAHRSDELQWIADHVRRLSLTTPWDEIAVLCRSLRTLRGPVTGALRRAGIPFRVAGGGRAAGANPWVARLVDLLEVAAGIGLDDGDPSTPLRVLDAAAVSPLVGAEPLGLREAFRAARRADDPEAALGVWADDTGADGVRGLLDAVAAARQAVRGGADVATAAWALWSRLPARERLEAAAGDHDGGAGSAARSAADVEGGRAVGAWHEALASFVARNPGACSVADYLDTLTDDDADDTWVADREDAAAAVHVLTVHQAKGLEFRHVVVPALEEGRFPALSPGGDAAEERRLLYVALTRAEETVTLTATLGTEDRAEASPSRFFTDLAEHLVDPASLLPAAPTPEPLAAVATVTDARRAWGRIVRDVAADEGDRLVAAEGLRALDGGGAVGLPWVAAGDLTPLRPLRRTPWRLSASSIATYLGCGRLFLYDRVLRLAPWQESPAAAFGNAVHGAVSGWLLNDEAPDRAALELRLAAAFESEAVPAMPVAVQRESFRRRLPVIARQVAEVLLADLGDVVEVERQLEVDGPGGVRFVAKPDLVVTGVDGGVEVVDWKTSAGRNKPRDASGDVQLAVYHHVVGSALGRPVRRLRLAYVADGLWSEQPVTLGHDDACAALVEVAAAGVTAEHFEVGASPPCRYCAAKSLCDRQPRGQDLPW